MNKIPLIIRREYMTRVRKKSFLIMTILGPLLMAGIFIVPVWMATQEEETQHVVVVDESHLFTRKLPESETLKFYYPYEITMQEAEEKLRQDEYTAVLYIHEKILTTTQGVKLKFKKQPGFSVIRNIENAIENEIEEIKLSEKGIDKNTLEAAKSSVNLITMKVDESGNEERSNAELSMIVGFLSGLLIYFFIFMYGAQVMRGVIEEKVSRIVEVIISSVRPFQLMMGKIIGVALVGLTQFMLWVVLTFGIVSVAQTIFADKLKPAQQETPSLEEAASGQFQLQPGMQEQMPQNDEVIAEAWEHIRKINFPLILSAFLFYFIGGYLLYGALFAAVGSAVDSEADTQQFMLPITVPLILAFVMAQFIMENPEGPVAFWFSMIPLTSPVIMMVRIPFGIPIWELALSMALLVAGFIFTTWLAGKIYRTGILMYGKKVNYKELWKWIRYH